MLLQPPVDPWYRAPAPAQRESSPASAGERHDPGSSRLRRYTGVVSLRRYTAYAAAAVRRLPADHLALVRGLAAFGSAEVANRIVRIVAIVVIARRIDAAALGIAALSLSLFELVRVLANSGIGQRIIAATPEALDGVCNTARRLFVIWCSLVALIQLAVAALLYRWFDQPQAAAMLAVLACVYWTMPPGLVQIFLLMREGRLGAAARIGAAQTMADHVLTVLLALCWPSGWAIVLPKLLTTPIWLVLARRARPWRRVPNVAAAPVADFVRYGAGVLGSELGNAARLQLGNIIIGASLGVTALGTYYFAFNAGLGITASFVSAFTTVLFPQLCRRSGGDRHRAYRRGLTLALIIITPLLLVQVGFAHVYIPLLFGARWRSAASLVGLLALAALPLVASAATTAFLRAEGRTGRDATINLTACAAALVGLALGAQVGLAQAAIGYVAGLALTLLPATIWLAADRPVRPAAPEAAVPPTAPRTPADPLLPEVSVVVAAHNAGATVRATIASVLAQRGASFELIVIDDGSTDETLRIVRAATAADPRVRIVSGPNRGVAAARNRGAGMARGGLIAFLDADDLWHPTKLACHAALHRRLASSISFAGVAFIEAGDTAIAGRTRSSVPAGGLSLTDLVADNPVCTASNLVVTRAAFVEIGGFDVAMAHAEDQEWLVRAAAAGHAVTGMPDVLVGYRMSPAGLSADLAAMHDGWRRLAAPYGALVDLARAEAIYCRYLARRALRSGSGAHTARRYALRGLCLSSSAFLSDPRRGAMTVIAAILAPLVPPALQMRVFA